MRGGGLFSIFGIIILLTDTGKVIKRLRTSNKRRFKRRMKRFQKQYREGRITLFTKSKEDSDEKIKA